MISCLHGANVSSQKCQANERVIRAQLKFCGETTLMESVYQKSFSVQSIRCLDIRLKTIVSQEYRGIRSQVSFVTFFVLNAELLESMTLGIRTRDNNEEFLTEQRRKLQLEERVSRDAQFNFTTDRYLPSY